ncbi:hypothetical protein SMGD1_0269 [Sulfurimonas gotlandica GD1]|uniref:Co-chaperone DjlA N-terminal domain-containing protein n=1 Tax=Sulfurimonas gotlandica (strain DSM 19862 / JCM 16533 / GD1) TaxID=929558 RepID=B6BL58_SULGG|nr:TerB family tellurite resistance protein [Sulfurimonas gotlandica]EDZ61986.1 hypothetical protein CBGD1_2565 [Sulfurimonas gotlandica GD1]EHP28796.1 hypothetical protein SMGD1_0269 [Sulfurimonas gotlandica GD1]
MYKEIKEATTIADKSAVVAESVAVAGVKSMEREGNNYKELIKYIRSIPGDIVKKTVYIGPNFIKFIFAALNSKSTDTKTKLLFTGIIVSLSTLLGLMVWDISLITMLFAIGAFAGPATIIGGVMFGSLIVLIKSALTAFIVLVSMKLSNMMYEDTEIEAIAIEAFGKEDGKSFVQTFNQLTAWDNGNIDKFLDLAMKYFNKLGEKFENKDLTNIEEKISKLTIKQNLKSKQKTKVKSSLLNQLKSLTRGEELDENMIVSVITLLYHAVSIDGEVSNAELDILVNFIKNEYLLDDEDVQNLFKQINKEEDFDVLLNELQGLLSKNQIEDVVKIIEKIISADDVITNEEQLLLDAVKKQLL